MEFSDQANNVMASHISQIEEVRSPKASCKGIFGEIGLNFSFWSFDELGKTLDRPNSLLSNFFIGFLFRRFS